MGKKILNSRIVQKHDTEANWSISNFIPMKGELIIYDIDSTHTNERLKIGDGKTVVSSLPFVTGNLEALIDSLDDKIGDTSVSEQISDAIDGLTASDIGADAAGAASAALANAKIYTDSEMSEWVGDTTVSSQISSAIGAINPANIGAIDINSGVIMLGDITTLDSLGNKSCIFRTTGSEVTGLPDKYSVYTRFRSSANGSYDLWLQANEDNMRYCFTADGYFPSDTSVWKTLLHDMSKLTLTGNQYSYYSDNTKYGLNCNNSDIIKVNSIYTADAAEYYSEGILFYRNGTVWDGFTANSGVFYFGSSVGTGNVDLKGSADIRCGDVKTEDGTNSGKYYVTSSVNTEGTSSTGGIGCITIGNSTATGTAGNAKGLIRCYDAGTKYVQLYASSGTLSANKTMYLDKIPQCSWDSSTGTLTLTT